MDDLQTVPQKHTLRVDKWEDNRTPADGAPDDTVEFSVWYEGGRVVTSADRIQELEASAIVRPHPMDDLEAIVGTLDADSRFARPLAGKAD